jgi:hypothetical protein
MKLPSKAAPLLCIALFTVAVGYVVLRLDQLENRVSGIEERLTPRVMLVPGELPPGDR